MTRRLENRGSEVCQSCGQEIAWNSPVIAVRYGTILFRVNHTGVTKDRVDYFHDNGKCEVGIRSKSMEPEETAMIAQTFAVPEAGD